MELRKVYKDYQNVKFIVAFEDEINGQELQVMELRREPTYEFLQSFMRNQGFTKVTVKEKTTRVETFGFDYLKD